MRINDIINSGKKFFSIEVSPPSKSKSIKVLFNTIDRFLPYNPAYVSITHHPLKITPINVDISKKSTKPAIEFCYLNDVVGTDGTIKSVPAGRVEIESNVETKKLYQKKHVNPIALCAAIKYKYDIIVIPHFVCAGMNIVQVEESLLDFSFLGLEHILALRGDPATANETFKPIDGGFSYASELVTKINAMKHSVFMNKEDRYKSINLCVGIAGYPEMHKNSISQEEDIKFLKQKVDAGADFIVTQMCFDAQVFIDWIGKLREAGITIPVIPGIKPLTAINQLIKLKYEYGINIPKELEELITTASDSENAYQRGIDHCVELSKKLLDSGFPGIHYFTMGNGKDIEDVVKQVF